MSGYQGTALGRAFNLIDKNTLERKDMLIFVNEIDGRDLRLDKVPPNHSWNEQRSSGL